MSVHYEIRGTIAVLQIDNPPVNGLSHVVRSGLADGIERALDDAKIKAIVITGTDKVFSGGADIREFNTPAMVAEPNLLRLIEAIEAASKPTIAAINGVCMGGGLEVALACNYRIATAKASLGLPEVKIGLIPGAGGTQRLPRAVGVELALRMITTGEPISGDQAERSALVERLMPDTTFQGVLDFATEIAARPSHPRLRAKATALPPGADAAAFFAAARAAIAKQARGLTAPLACVDAIEGAVTRSFDEGLARERSIFIARLHSGESKALRYGFFAERTAARVADVPEETPARAIRTAAVIGFGTMGAGIAMAFANAGIPVQVVESKADTLDRGMAGCRANWERSVRKGRLTQEEAERRLALLRPTLKFEDIGAADIVIEAVFEDMGLKQQIFQKLDKVMRRGAILATNTSSLDVNRIAAATARPQDVIGTHFFSPAHVMRLLEVIRADHTAKDVLASMMRMARQLKKVAVVSGVCDGFIGNRMLDQYRRQALLLVEEGASVQQVDAALTNFGMAMGVFAMSDLAGLDVAYAIRQNRRAENPDLAYPRLADRLVELGRLGQKTGKGYYGYAPASRVPIPDPDVEALIDTLRRELGIRPRAIADEEIVERCIFALVNEGCRIVEDGIAMRGSDIDVVYVHGYGFPAGLGGPMYYADSLGLDRVIEAMRRFAPNEHAEPNFWTPAQLLLTSAEQGRRLAA